uniref:Uncharacterized protein n=1 Tax=Globodera pallida TaxID=36090 RepID=A0A183C9Z5_GLOPA
MMAKCEDKWGECFPRDGYKGDACCDKGSSWKCVNDMTEQEKSSKDPVYEILFKCMPDLSKCKSPSLCKWVNEEQRAEFAKCPRKFKCFLRKHSNMEALKRCIPKNDDNTFENCNAPMPPIENAIEA